MSRNKLSNFFVLPFFSQPFFAFFSPTKLAQSCFVSAANEEIVATEALREVSAIGKEMIDNLTDLLTLQPH